MVEGLVSGIVMIIIAIALGVGAFIPMSIGQQSSNFNCKTQTDGICQPGEKCIDGKCTAPEIEKTTHMWYLFVSLIILVIAVGIIYYTRTAESGRGGAQMVGMVGESGVFLEIKFFKTPCGFKNLKIEY